ncbi:hypothetical protein RIR_jg24376.t1 [Rhizophagus irregularis DAOM 181602=DAOM 197198]|nr:hypothetical protein RIR_jg24376.t1 [Rhizophagus irregularis DAOM 181602=DAOM 197198]
MIISNTKDIISHSFEGETKSCAKRGVEYGAKRGVEYGAKRGVEYVTLLTLYSIVLFAIDVKNAKKKQKIQLNNLKNNLKNEETRFNIRCCPCR